MARKKRFHPATKAEPGNLKALKHGATSEQMLAPVRERHREQLRRDYPDLDERTLALKASRLARIELAENFLEQHGVVKNDDGEVYPVADRLEKWSRRAEDLLRLAQAEKHQHRPAAFDLSVAMADLPEGASDDD